MTEEERKLYIVGNEKRRHYVEGCEEMGKIADSFWKGWEMADTIK